jgi:hypothetical protein
MLFIDKAKAIAPLHPANHRKNCFLLSKGSLRDKFNNFEHMKIFINLEKSIIRISITTNEKLNLLNNFLY